MNIELKLVLFDTFQFSNDLISDKDEQLLNIKLKMKEYVIYLDKNL